MSELCIQLPLMNSLFYGMEKSFLRLSRQGVFDRGIHYPPYLFFLCLEKLSHFINEAVERGQWIPLSITSRGPHLSHVCFADDIVLFGEASTSQLSCMTSILDSFCQVERK